MEIFVDGVPQNLEIKGTETIGDVIGKVSSNLVTDKRIIDVFLNGEKITGVSQKHLDLANSNSKLDIKTGLASDLANESLESIGDFHTMLIAEFEKASEEFRTGSFENASDTLGRCVDGLQILMKTTISVTSLLQISPNDIKAGENKLTELISRLAEVLDEMIQAQTNQDGILIADLIEYEIQPNLEDWKSGLDDLKTQKATA